MENAELNRLIANIIKKGEIAEVDPAACRVRVQHGGLLTDWLPYFVPAAGGVSVHRPPSVGEIALVLSPSGEPADGVVLCGWSGNRYTSPAADANNTVVRFPDGAECRYNHASGAMTITGIKTGFVQAANSLTFDCPQSTFTGKLNVNGLLTYTAGMAGSGGTGGSAATISGSLKVLSGDITADGISLKNHTHRGDSGGTTGTAQ